MPAYKKSDFNESTTVDQRLDPIHSATIAIQTAAGNHADADFEAYLSANDGASFFGPVEMIDAKARATPVTTLDGPDKLGIIDCSGCTHVRIKRKAGGPATATQGASWSVTTL